MRYVIRLLQDALKKGMTPRAVQEIMGHANYNTTVSYTHVLDVYKIQRGQKRVGEFLQ